MIKLFVICKTWTEVQKVNYFTILCRMGQEQQSIHATFQPEYRRKICLGSF